MTIYAWVGQDTKEGLITGRAYKKVIFYTYEYPMAKRILSTGREVYKATTWSKMAELMKDISLELPLYHWINAVDVGLDYFRKARYDYHNNKKGFIE